MCRSVLYFHFMLIFFFIFKYLNSFKDKISQYKPDIGQAPSLGYCQNATSLLSLPRSKVTPVPLYKLCHWMKT